MELQRHKRNANLYYLQYIKNIIDTQITSLENFQRLLLTLSIMIVSFSIVAISMLKFSHFDDYKYLMNISYALFTITISASIVAPIMMFNVMSNLLEKYREFNEDVEKIIFQLSGTVRRIKWLNFISAFTFVGALLALGGFMYLTSTLT